MADEIHALKSTTVEIILYYLTNNVLREISKSTTVEIILYYLTPCTVPI